MSRGRVVDRHILYLGEVNDSQRASWLKSIEAFDEHHQEQRRLALYRTVASSYASSIGNE